MITGFWQKLGLWPQETINTWKQNNNWIWFHAVSVGELNAIWPLITEVNKQRASYPIMISTTTFAGFNLAKQLTKNTNLLVFYFPFDIPIILKRIFNFTTIKLLVIAETEIWPFTLNEATKRDIPILLVNARLSNKSFKGYLFFKFFFKKIINLFTEILSQSEADTRRFLELGLNQEKIKTIGNIKFVSNANITTQNGNKNHNDSKFINIIFASTHNTEEELALCVFKEIKNTYKNIQLTIAPRHINRTKEICNLVINHGLNPILKTQNQSIKTSNDVFILDTIGELTSYYKHCLITVLGGTFAEIGGHNILEPIRSHSYTIIGPNDFKISDLTNQFKERKAIVQVSNKTELTSKIKEAISNDTLRETTIRNGLEIIKENENILTKTLEHLFKYL